MGAKVEVEIGQEVPDDAVCACGQRLPWHLFRLGLGETGRTFEHVCSCSRAYTQEGGSVRRTEDQDNPFARFEEVFRG
jgi:hypothetical protein